MVIYKYLLKSTNAHGVHSPFVYDLLTKCLYVKREEKYRRFVVNYKRCLFNSKETIFVKDFGAGSKVFSGSQREVAKIAKVASISNKNALNLIRLISYLKLETILELGTSLGVATAAMRYGNPTSKITTLEGCDATIEVARKQFSYFKLKNIEAISGEFMKTLPFVLENTKYDLIYFDGNHSKNATLTYFKMALEAKHNTSVFIFDDIHWSREMTEAWDEIRTHKDVTVSIDSFQWGMVFFRKEQRKEHFTIRI